MSSSVQKVMRRVSRRIRMALRRDQRHEVGAGAILVLPPEHLLPIHQAEQPLYDRYFLAFFTELGASSDGVFIVDVGANVGDTAVAISSVAPQAQILCVEGSEYFNRYLIKNITGHPHIQNLEAFVDVGAGEVSYQSDRSTGHLVAGSAPSKEPAVAMVSVADLLQRAPDLTTRVWKSDTDGFDISILAKNFTQITEACQVIWIEYDPIENLSDPADIAHLLELISTLDRELMIFDNLGHRMLRIPCSDAPMMLLQLQHWLALLEGSGSRVDRIAYFDLWILDSRHADWLDDSASSNHP